MVHTPKAFGHKKRQSVLADLLRPPAEVATPDSTKAIGVLGRSPKCELRRPLRRARINIMVQPCFLAAEAIARHLADGQRVRLFKGPRLGRPRPCARQRPDREINILYSDRYTDIGEGATYQSNWVDIAVWDNAAR